MADLFAADNGRSVLTAVGVSGNAAFMSGCTTVQYQASSNGAVPIKGCGARRQCVAADAKLTPWLDFPFDGDTSISI